MGVLDPTNLRESIAEMELERSELQRRLQEVQAEFERSDRQLALLRELLRLRAGDDDGSTPSGAVPAPGATQAVPDVRKPLSDAERVAEEVKSILGAEGRPMPIRVIYNLLKDRNTPLPGQGRMVNVIGAIMRDPGICRPSRGVYGLAGWDGMVATQQNAKSTSQPPRSRRQRKPSRRRGSNA